MRLGLFALIGVLFLSQNTSAFSIRYKQLPFRKGLVSVRVGEFLPEREPIADLIYLHGFADRLDNHKPLFKAWTDQGIRVISFDLPSHGHTKGVLNYLDTFSFRELVKLVGEVERSTFESNRPLLVAGWSTGGLIAIRVAKAWVQSNSKRKSWRKPSGLILYAPGVAVKNVLRVRESTLTRNPNPPHEGPLVPTSPLLNPVFAARLKFTSIVTRWQKFPKNLPTLVFLGDDEADQYIHTKKVRNWAVQLRKKGAQVRGIQCPGAYHELDNEIEPVARAIRFYSGLFAASVALGKNRPQFQTREFDPSCFSF